MTPGVSWTSELGPRGTVVPPVPALPTAPSLPMETGITGESGQSFLGLTPGLPGGSTATVDSTVLSTTSCGLLLVRVGVGLFVI